MTTVERYEPGTFCWVELATTDLDAGRKFYEGIFGWKTEVRSFEGMGDYATFSVADGRGAAGGYMQQEGERSMGVPPHWNLYIFSDEVDKDAAKAAELGGQVTVPPMDLQMGRMAVIADPTGARFCLGHSEQMPGFTVRGEHGSFVWADLITPDTGRAKEVNGEEQIGGFMNPRQPETPPNWMSYFSVDDAQAVFDAATKAGAQVMMPPTPIPPVGTFEVLADPHGA